MFARGRSEDEGKGKRMGNGAKGHGDCRFGSEYGGNWEVDYGVGELLILLHGKVLARVRKVRGRR